MKPKRYLSIFLVAATLSNLSTSPAFPDDRAERPVLAKKLFLAQAAGGTSNIPASTVEAAQPTAMCVLIFDTHCKTACDLVRPIMKELKGELKDCFNYVELDSSNEKLPESQKTAKQLGIHGFLADYAQWVPIVGVFTAKKKCIKVIQGPKAKDVYMAALQKALQCK